MIGRIVEIAGKSRYLSVDRGFMIISTRGEELARVPLDDIAGLICNSHSLTYSNQLLMALAGRGCPIVLCGKQHHPVGFIWPAKTHHLQGYRLDLQIRLTVPRRKQIWKQIVRSKIQMQSEVLRLCGRPHAPLSSMVRKVSSGDASNIEGQAARTYWSLLFGPGFRRDTTAEDINALLNYGYAVVRSCVARHLMACGLHPGIGLHHSNDGNAFRLVDDLMEPFRPVVDAWVWTLQEAGRCEVDADTRKALGLIPTRTLQTERGRSPVTLVIERLCATFVGVLEDASRKLEMPHESKQPLQSLLSTTPWEGTTDDNEETED